MTFDELVGFIENRMHMSHVYQPLLIRSLVAAGGGATLRQLALSFLVEDESQILFYEDRVEKMPVRVLKKHGVIKQDGDLIMLRVDPLTYQQRSRIRELCERKLQTFLQQRGLDVWAYRMIETDPVPEVLRYQALVRARGRCALCGATKDQTTLHVDHIIPRSRGGKNALENLQVLCAECNLSKSNTDSTDFRVAEASADPSCPFCDPAFRSRAVARNDLSFAMPHADPVTDGHLLVIPFRHTPDFFAMTGRERHDSEDLLRYLKSEMQTAHPEIQGFNVMVNCGTVAGQAVPHAHIHLVPRRSGDGVTLPAASPGR